MEVSEEAFLDCSGPNADGTYDFRYEGTYTLFTFDEGRSLRARRYVDTPTEAALFFGPGGPDEEDDETRAAVEWLRQAGVATVKVLGGPLGGYRPIRQLPSDAPLVAPAASPVEHRTAARRASAWEDLPVTATPFAQVGRIVSAPRDPSKVGFFIEVVDDTAGSTGGAYIFTWLAGVGFDDWVEGPALVDAAMKELSYAVEWFDAPPPDSIAGRHHHA